jgi:diguanylate cyclase (GGDEF)-like protein
MAAILIADEPSTEREALVALLGAGGHAVTVTPFDDALARWRAGRHELAILDGTRPVCIETAARMKAETPAAFAPVILVLSRPDVAARVAALAVADDALSRPYDPQEAVARCEALLRTRRIVDELRVARAESEARTLADTVTGLRNRAFLGERLKEEWKRAVRYNEPLSLLILAVDKLPELVEARGAPFGDKLLLAVANAAVRSLRQIDIVTRYSQSELGALLPNTHFAGSLTCAERLHKESAKVIIDELTPTVSMGIAFYPGKDVNDPADLFRTAGRALERAREEGPGSICLFQHQGYIFKPR